MRSMRMCDCEYVNVIVSVRSECECAYVITSVRV